MRHEMSKRKNATLRLRAEFFFYCASFPVKLQFCYPYVGHWRTNLVVNESNSIFKGVSVTVQMLRWRQIT